MSTREADSINDLIADCADIPGSLRPADTLLGFPLQAAPWQVDDANLAQVHDLDEYV